VIPEALRITVEAAMMGRRGEQWSLFYQFRLDELPIADIGAPACATLICRFGGNYVVGS
jgi:hypothetical protein